MHDSAATCASSLTDYCVSRFPFLSPLIGPCGCADQSNWPPSWTGNKPLLTRLLLISCTQSHGGVFENEPDSLLDIARSEEREDAAHLVVTTSAAERKNAFLKKAAEESKVKRLDPKVGLLSF
ncbi:unnamed protein product [Hydatigera taeniaeformis]|uniref:Uncharacterized protein n=1 Tax=Hydatigena taeniaeformis TaxID=6205 RepID=A0A0R3WWV3_HYDTA|nr:unnamed protein product [Hydatigera taeniaeformis]